MQYNHAYTCNVIMLIHAMHCLKDTTLLVKGSNVQD